MKSRKTLLLVSIASAAVLATTLVCAKEGGLFTNSLNAEGCRHTHVEHHAGIEPTLIRDGQMEYWCCCECHTSFADYQLTHIIENTNGNPTDHEDGRYLKALGESNHSSPVKNGVVSTMTPESGTAFDTVYEVSTSGQFVLHNDYISDCEELAFQIKAERWHYFHDVSGNYSGAPNVWTTYKLVQTEENIWNIYQRNEGLDFVLKLEDISGSKLQDVFKLDGDNCTYYVTNIRYIASSTFADGVMAAESALVTPINAAGEVSIPFGFKNLTKQALEDADNLNNYGLKFLADIDVNYFSIVRFGFRFTNRNFCRSDWTNELPIDEWNYAEVLNNGDGTFTSRIYNNNREYKFGYTGDSFRNAFIYANYGNGTTIPTWYSTEVIGELRSDIDSPKGQILAESAICENGALIEKTEIAAPEGFTNVYKTKQAGERNDAKFFSRINLEAYDEAYFAIRAQDGYLYLDGSYMYPEKSAWVTVKLTNNGDATFDIEYYTSGCQILSWGSPIGNNTLFTNTDAHWDIDNTYFTKGALNNIMWKRELFATAGSNIYVTELRVVSSTPIGDVIDDVTMSSNGVIVNECAIPAPNGYASLFKTTCTVSSDSDYDKYFSSKDLTGYSQIFFKMNAHGYFLFSGWKYYIDADEWVNIEITNKGCGLFDVRFTTTTRDIINAGSKTLLFENVDSQSYISDDFTKGALNTIFKNLGVGFQEGKELTFTELRGFKSTLNTSLVDECAISGNYIGFTKIGEFAPNGFESVYQISLTDTWMHGMFFSDAIITDYSEVHFAAKTSGYWSFGGGNVGYRQNQWVFFSLTNNNDGTFNFTVKDNANVTLWTQYNVSTYKGADPGVYTNYGINTVLYGNADTCAFKDGDNEFTMFATEVRGTQSGNLNLVTNSETEYNLIYDNNNRYVAKARVLFKENFEAATGVNNLEVKASASESFSANTKSISIGDTNLLRSSGALNGVNLDGGYMIKSVNESIFVYAENTSDYIVAVQDLMNMMFGYEHFAVNDVYIEHKNNIVLDKMNKIVNPSFSKRERIADAGMLDQDGAALLGYTAGYEWEYTGQPHALADRYANYDTYKNSHPNWFSTGKDKWKQTQHQLCYSAHGSATEYQALVDQVCNDIITEVNTNAWTFENSYNPTFTIDLSILDNWYQCDCASCKADLVTYGSFAGQQLHFVNDVANKMDVWFQTNRANIKHSYKMLAYQQEQKAPQSINYELNENIEIQFAPVYLDITQPLAAAGVNSEHYNDLLSWVNLFNSCNNVSAENISVWYYAYSTNNIVPIYDYDAFQQSYKNIRALGIKKISNQFITNGSQLTCFQDLNLYLKAQVMKDINVNLAEKTKDFIDFYYGSGASKINEFYQTMISNMKNTYTGDNTVFETHDSKTYWSKTVVKKLISLSEEAIADVEANETDPARKQLLINRINREKATAVYMLLEYGYASLFDRRDYKDFFEETCTLFGITHIDTSTTVEQWL